ncbi:MAG: hypothetical protein JXR83_22340, partial [Deltaproteobacteria bacterium]|nr:hypothetical protein [Deltaproteobacteria bacterium]
MFCALALPTLLHFGCPPSPVSTTDGASSPDAAAADTARTDAGPGDRGARDLAAPDLTGRDLVGVDGGSCTTAEQCAAGLGCVDHVCRTCRSGADCRASLREGCSALGCGPCSIADECAPGLGCRAATGECHDCRLASECRAGEGCV